MNFPDTFSSPLDTAGDCILAVHGGAGVLSRESAGNGGYDD